MLDKYKKKKKKVVSSKSSKTRKKTLSNKAKIRKKEAMKKRKQKKRIIFLTLFIVITLAIIATLYYLLTTPKFNISSIAVTGNNIVAVDEVLSGSGVKLGDNVVKSYFKVDRNKLTSIPYIENVSVSIKLPYELNITVKERVSIYYAYDKEKNVYYRLDENGVILEVCDRIELKNNEVLVNAVTFDNEVELGTKINEIDYSKILVYEKIAKEFLEIFPEQKITKVSFENSLTTIYINDKVEVILPNDTNLQYNLTFLKEILDKVSDVKGTIDMTKDDPTLISF